MKNIFTEAIDLTEAVLDVENRLLRNVVLIQAGMSLNRRYYGEDVLRKARPLFEGAKAYNDHSMWGHPPTSLTGWYSNVRYEGGKLVADRYFTRTQAGQDIMALAEDIVSGRAPKTLAGLSIAVVGEGTEREYDDGIAVEVTAITAVSSVDDVTEPAAGGAYMAAGMEGGLMGQALADLSFEDWLKTRPEFVERLKREWKTTRLSEDTKAALAEADRKVKAAEADAGRLRKAVQKAQTTIKKVTEERDAAVANEASARREIAVVEALYAIPGLPVAFRQDLRERLVKADPKEWGDIISREKRKAQALPRQRVTVTGAEALEQSPVPVQPAMPLVPLDGEGIAEWADRISRF